MKRSHVLGLGALAFCFLLIGGMGCSKSTTSTTAGNSMTATASKSLMESLGGVSSVNNLADSFASNLSSNPAVTKFLNADAISSAKLGLVNEIAKASGMAPPNPGADLKQALSGKGMDADAVNAVNGALASAADAQKVGATEKTALMGLIDPISKSVLGN